MPDKPIIDPQQFVDEVNRRLPKHALYQDGMRIKLFPDGSSAYTATGFEFEGPADTAGVSKIVEAQVLEEFTVQPWPPGCG